MNKIILIGRLGADPVQRETKAGVSVVHFPLATSRRVRTEDSESPGAAEFTEETQWHRVVAWGKQGENCAQFLGKGHSVFVEGSVRSHKYEGRDGENRVAFEVYAENVIFLSRPVRAGNRSESEGVAVVTPIAAQA